MVFRTRVLEARLLWLLVSLSPAVALAEPAEEEWAIIQVLADEEQEPVAALDKVREAIGTLSEGEVRVLGEAETLRRMGSTRVSMGEIDEWIEEGELYFFQLDYGQALERLERALAGLEGHVGDASWERGRSLRLHAALISLQRDEGEGGEREGTGFLRPLAGVQPQLELDEALLPQRLVDLWARVLREVQEEPEGWLRVECLGGCVGGRTWLEAYPVGNAGSAIGMPSGRYRLKVTDALLGEERSSLSREVTVRSGEEAVVVVDLALESSIRPYAGPAFVQQGASRDEVVERLGGLARSTRAEKTLAIQQVAREGEEILVFSLFDREGAVLYEGAQLVEEDGGGEVEEEVLLALSGEVVSWWGGERGLTRADPALFTKQEAPRSSFTPAAKWSTVALTAAMAATGGWLMLDAAAGREELRRMEASPGAYAGVREGRRAEALAGSVQRTETWSAVMWTGAAVGTVASLFLFLSGEGSAAVH